MEERYNEVIELVRRVRHDASNPLTVALGHVQLLLDDPAVTDPMVRDELRIVETELRRLAAVLRRLAAVSSAAGASDLEGESVAS
ncbi:MAG: hypothetical protein IRZ00_01455 [Gemmatimonadetes bacterium]|nr:hypothetical protein [Gemmatimonadota bacterium]